MPTKKAPSKSAAGGCQIGELFRLLGEPHVLDILYVFLAESKSRRFVELQHELRLSPNTLTDRLKGLVAAGLLTRTAYNEIPPRVEYAGSSSRSLAAPSSHTTVRAMSHTAVSVKRSTKLFVVLN